MQGTAQATHSATHVFEGGDSPPPQGPDPQLSLPTGPVGLVRPRRERTDEDRQWYSGLLREAQHSRLTDKVVFERLAYYASLNPERVAFPSVARVAREIPSLSGKGSEHCSPRTVQYALRRLESAGFIQCLSRAGGRATAHYRVLDPTDCAPGVQEVRPRGATAAPEGLREDLRDGRADQNLNLLTCEAQSKGITVPASSTTKDQDIVLSGLPSPVKSPPDPDPGASAPVAEEPVFVHPKQAALLFALQRKLHYATSNQQAIVFDGMEHTDKRRILGNLLREEQIAAMKGRPSRCIAW